MAGFSSFSQRWRLTAEMAKDQITGLYAGTNHDSRYDVVSCHIDCQNHPSLIFILIVSFGRAARIPCIDASPSALLLGLLNPTEEPDARRQHSAEFARRSMEIPMAVQPSSA